MTMMIPTELIDHILSFLRPDFKTLEICSTVFPHLADRYLYSHVSLCSTFKKVDDGLFYWPKFHDFINQVDQHPHILFSVQNMQIIIAEYPSTPDFLPIISKFLPKFSKLQSINLKALAPFFWDELKPDLSAAFQKCFQSLSINQVSIHNINRFPLNLFDNCQNLKRLDLKGRRFTGVSTLSYPPLSSLHINIPFGPTKISAYLPKIVSWMNSRTLQSLSISILQPIDLRPLFEACSPTLLTLDLRMNCGGELCFNLFKTHLISFSS